MYMYFVKLNILSFIFNLSKSNQQIPFVSEVVNVIILKKIWQLFRLGH